MPPGEARYDVREGNSLAAEAARRGATPAGAFLGYLKETGGQGLVYYPVLNQDLGAVAEMITNPDVVIGLGDTGAHVALTMDAGQPTYVLAHWVRDEKRLDLGQAVHKLTQEGAVAEAVGRSGIEPELVDDVVLGESLYGGGDIARYAAIEAGLVGAPGLAHNRHCASGLAAVRTAAASVIAGMDRVVVAGGVQSSSTMPVTNRRVPGTDTIEEDWLAPSHREMPDAPIRDMSVTVGWNAAVKAGVSREDMDAWAFRSHMRAVAGIDNGSFAEEIFPIEVTRRDGASFTFAVDEHPRRTSTLEKLASLKPLHPEIEGFSITAGNAAGVNDGAAAVVVNGRSFAEGRGLRPLAVIRAWASAGVSPADTGIAPSIAIPKALDRAGLKIGDIALWEINEAFASVPVAVTGARMVLTLIGELRRRGGGTAVAAMCAGGGMASALILEVPAPS